MIKSYFKIAFRNIKSSKVYSGINIIGLSIGLAAFLLIATVVINELSYDKDWSKGDRIYRLIEENTALDKKNASIAAPLGPQLAANFDQVETYARIENRVSNFKLQQDPVQLQTLETNPSILEILDFKVLQGTPSQFVEGYPNLIISKKIKDQYFPNSNPVGKIIENVSNFGSNTEYYISGVIKDLPVNTHLRADVMVIEKPKFTEFSSNKFTPNFNQYLLLKPGVSEADFIRTANNWYSDLPTTQKNLRFSLQPIEDIYLNSNNYFQTIKGNKNTITILSCVAVLLLVIACINFINLSTARTIKKNKDTILRKVLGASRSSLIAQFLAESFLFFGISYVLGLSLYYLFLPSLESFLDQTFSLTIIGNIQLLTISFLAVGSVSLLTGIYPALIISQPNSEKGISNTFKANQNSEIFRKGLVTLQFVITIGVIVGTLVVNNQLAFLNTKDLGFNKENLFRINFTNWGDKGEAFEKEIKKIAGVKNASIGQWIPSSVGGTFHREIEDPQSPENKIDTWYIDADKNFFSTLELQLIEGRGFQNEFSAEKSLAEDLSEEKNGLSDAKPILITAYTAKRLNITTLNKPYKQLKGIPIGIVKNFHNQSLRNPLAPTIIRSIQNPKYGNMLIKIETENPNEVATQIRKKYNEFFPENLFSSSWIAEDVAHEFKAENKLRSVLVIFSVLIVFLSCLGLLGLITFMVQSRTKEISVRKVLGASVLQIVSVFSKSSLKLIVLSAVIAVPISWYVLDRWLGDFAYKINIGPLIFIKSIMAVLAIALLTIGLRIVGAALKNPVDNLRAE
ncbi:FtsX-like permease family protein [Zunongwangia sp.]|uniref:ABC transporter permease n=1 Tax=Zunongwangia sp. TaxID=1965325 RepID=UPI003AA908C6